MSGLSGKEKAKWNLAAPHNKDTQGIVVSGFSKLPNAVAVFLQFGWTGRGHGKWLGTLDTVAPIADADGRDPRAAALAFTWSGLAAIGLERPVLESFSLAFKEGMFQVDRLRRLGDQNLEGAWTESVIPSGPAWGGNAHVGCPARADGVAGRDDDKDDAPEDRGSAESAYPASDFVETPTTVHALLILYEETAEKAAVWCKEVAFALGDHGVAVVRTLALDLHGDAQGLGHEHFGFADGISQPLPYSMPVEDGAGDENAVLLNGVPAARDRWNGVPLGEILFGHTNAHHEKAPGPLVTECALAEQAGLSSDAAPTGFRNLGLDGSYMVVRELLQDTAAFWKSMNDSAERIRTRDPSAAHVDGDWIAERVVGRSRNGHLLCPKGHLPPETDGFPQNDFGYRRDDPHGIGCPVGSHVRRANPRDGLAKDLAAAQTLLDAANSHRILRRGRKFGKIATSPPVADGENRGLLFMCLNTDIARQFEFVQQNWMLNCNFATLFDETDPLVGPEGRFTIPEEPLRRTVKVETFVKLAGGEYFFLPSLAALRYLAAL